MKEILKRMEAVFSRGSETLFLFLMTLEITDYLINRIWWNVEVPYLDTVMAYVKLTIYLVALWVLSITLSFCLFCQSSEVSENGEQRLWRELCAMSGVRLMLMLSVCIVIGFLLHFILGKSETVYKAIVSTLVILLAWEKNHKRISRLFLALFSGTIVVAVLGLLLGYTHGGAKVGAYGTGFALGMTYPNTWARVFFLAVVLIWYEWLQEKPIWTFLLFLFAAVPTLFIVKCRTIALLMILFPVIVMAKNRVLKTNRIGRRRALKNLLIAMPFICFVITLLLCSQMELLHKLTYENYLRNMSKRFVQGGIALKEYGLPLFGRNIDLGHNISVVLNGEMEDLYILDCGYISYGLSRGMIWLFVMMVWQGFANYKCIRNRDYGMLIIGLFMSLLALMEREGFDPWYNLTLLYPLAETMKTSVQKST